MSISSKLKRVTQHRIQKYVQHSNANQFFNLLTSNELLWTVEDLLPEHRERHYPPTQTLSMFLAQALSADRSCQRVVNQMTMNRVATGLLPTSTATGGYCKARQRLPLTMVSSLVRKTAVLLDEGLPQQWRWHGKRVRLIDGTTVTMPDTLANQSVFPQQGRQQPGLGFPICRIVGAMCLSSGMVLNASIGRFNGKGSDEHTLLRGILDTFTAGDVVLGDAFYGTYFLLAALIEKGVDVVFEQMGQRRRVTDFRTGVRLGERDHLINIPKPVIKPDWMSQAQYERLPDYLTIRELKVGHKVLITTLLSSKQTSKSELKALYQKRWQIEVDFRHIKTTLGMETLSCKTPQMNEKEIWVYFLAYNLIRLLMAQAALLVDILPRQLSFKHTLQLWLAWRQYDMHIDDEPMLFILIAKKRVGNRLGRIEPRAVKRRPKPLPLLMLPRQQAREKVIKYGHPKKLK